MSDVTLRATEKGYTAEMSEHHHELPMPATRADVREIVDTAIRERDRRLAARLRKSQVVLGEGDWSRWEQPMTAQALADILEADD